MNKYFLFFSILFVTLLSSCDKQGEASVKEVNLNVVAHIESAQHTRGPIDDFPIGSNLGLFITNGWLGQPYANIPNNVKCLFNGSIWVTDGAFLGGTFGTVYAYYPYNEYYKGDGREIPVEAALQIDYLFGKGSNVVNMDNPTVNIEMKHAMSKLAFMIKKANYSSEAVLKSISVAGENGFQLPISGSLNCETGQITETANGVTTISCNETISDTYKQYNSMLLIPTATNGNHVVAIVTIQTPVKEEKYKVSFPQNSQWIKGRAYVYPLILSGSGIEINDSDVTIIPWGNTLTGNVDF